MALLCDGSYSFHFPPSFEIRTYNIYIVRILPTFSRCEYGSSELPLPLNAEVENIHYSKPIHEFYLLVAYCNWFRPINAYNLKFWGLSEFCGENIITSVGLRDLRETGAARGHGVEPQARAKAAERRARTEMETEKS